MPFKCKLHKHGILNHTKTSYLNIKVNFEIKCKGLPRTRMFMHKTT